MNKTSNPNTRRKIRANKNLLELRKNLAMQRKKIYFIGFGISFCFVVLLSRVYYIQAKDGDQFQVAVANKIVNSNSSTSNDPIRGDIVDRNGESIAVSVPVYTVALDVDVLVNTAYSQDDPEKYIDNIFEPLSGYLNIPIDTLNGYVEVTTDDKGKTVPVDDTNWQIIAKNVSQETVDSIQGDSNIKYVYFEKHSQRDYVQSDFAPQTIGFIRGDSSWGIENEYDDYLSGQYTNDPSNDATAKISGCNVVTTLDSTIQQFTQKAVDEAGEGYQAEHAAAIVMSPNTGEVYAMAQYPNFNPNDPTNFADIYGDNYESVISGLTDDEQMNLLNEAWTNYNISSSFEPGSIFKPVVASAAFDEGAITPDTTFYCPGYKIVDDATIHCDNRNGHGQETFIEALENSCNVAFMDIGADLGPEYFYQYQTDFGYGEKTGIDLPGEVDCKNLMYSEDELNPVELATSSFGQGFNSTPMQDITAFSAIINGGNLLTPYLVSEVVDDSGNVVYQNQPTVKRKVISQETSDYMRVALESVVSPTGTGHKAYIPGYSIGGKTGTAQQGDRDNEKYTLTFIAYLPVEDPQYILMGTIDNTVDYTEGGTSVAPMVKEILLDLIDYANIQPSYDVGEADTPTDNITLDDLTGLSLQDATAQLVNEGLDYDIIGSGDTVKTQIPPVGTSVEPGTKIYLYAETSGSDVQLVEVPDVTGLTTSEAETMMQEAGFDCVVETAKQDDSITSDVTVNVVDGEEQNTANASSSNENVVESQMPSPGISIPEGTEVKIVVKQ